VEQTFGASKNCGHQCTKMWSGLREFGIESASVEYQITQAEVFQQSAAVNVTYEYRSVVSHVRNALYFWLKCAHFNAVYFRHKHAEQQTMISMKYKQNDCNLGPIS